ncbi:MAG TPA: gephyrin-like molybdotransferase Glp [Gemmatimonadaceae bacterium]|jgi:molybdopterin molybdotransferase|nr:gephyrin-like molybdotransferase Glp [Gemmatimonadaceae bacterium]
MLSVPEASTRILEHIGRLPAERVPLLDALGRVLAESVRAPMTLPAWDNSAMDGYAVRAADIDAATPDQPVRLRVLETVAAGAFPTQRVSDGEAIRIMTGAPLPDGADTVVRVEDTDAGATEVLVRDSRDARRNVRPRGEDFREGDALMDPGSVLGPAQLGVLASVGRATVEVHRRPHVGIMGSGDELVDLDRFHEVLAGRKIVSSNGYTLNALVRSAGGVPVDLGVARDDPVSLRDHLARSSGCDLLITSAGVSVGEFDYTREVLASLGAEMKFWRVRMRPGAPLGFGLLSGMPWIGLPGNPVSAMVTFELFVRPVVLRMLGHDRLFRRPIPVLLDEPVSIGARLTHFLRCVVSTRDDGVVTAKLTGPQGSGILTSMSRANALLVVPETRPRVEAGETLHAIPLGAEAALTTVFAL